MFGIAFATICGTLMDDVQVKFIGANSTKIANFRVKVSYPKRRPEDQYGDVAFIDAKAWAYVADKVENGRKGDVCHFAGRLVTESWEKDGKKHYKQVIVVDEAVLVAMPAQAPRAEPNDSRQQQRTEQRQDRQQKMTAPPTQAMPDADGEMDYKDLPF